MPFSLQGDPLKAAANDICTMGRPAEISEVEHQSREILEREFARLGNAVKHLKRSNKELVDARSRGDQDPEIEQALQVCGYDYCSLCLETSQSARLLFCLLRNTKGSRCPSRSFVANTFVVIGNAKAKLLAFLVSASSTCIPVQENESVLEKFRLLLQHMEQELQLQGGHTTAPQGRLSSRDGASESSSSSRLPGDSTAGLVSNNNNS